MTIPPPPAQAPGLQGSGTAPRLRRLLAWAQAHLPAALLDVEEVAGDAGSRRYYRLRMEGVRPATRILMDAPDQMQANAAFRHVGSLWIESGARVPRVHAADDALGVMLLDDVGSTTMLQRFERHGTEDAGQWLAAAHAPLLRWQSMTRPGALPPYDDREVRRELALFREWYLPHRFPPAVPPALDRDVKRLFDAVSARFARQPRVFVHRDYMPRNLMPGATPACEPAVIDFQDARVGPISYDVVSLYRDAFVSHSASGVQAGLMAYHGQALDAGLPVPAEPGVFLEDARWVAVQRHLKVLGVFARLARRDRRPRYLADEARFIAYLTRTAAESESLRPLLVPVLAALHDAGAA